MKVAVIGAGSWGTTLANMLAEKEDQVVLWVREAELLQEIKEKGENTWFLPGIRLQAGLETSNDFQKVLDKADIILLCVPCQYLRSVLREIKALLPDKAIVVCASKGIELESLSPMSVVVQDELQDLSPIFAVLSGPSFAAEVSRKLPTAVALGCARRDVGIWVQEVLSTEYFRVYLNSDYRGVELGGALKNVIALAAGIADGLEFGSDARAALITRGLVEMARLGEAFGGSRQTFNGLSGMGDLVLTCTGDLSRNRQVGLRIGRGESLEDILQGMKMVAEGVKTTEALYHLSRKLEVKMPITEQVYKILFQDKPAAQAVKELMLRELKEE